MGVEQNVTVEENQSVTKSNPSNRELQHKRIIDSLVEAGTYSPALDLLIEVYRIVSMNMNKQKKLVKILRSLEKN